MKKITLLLLLLPTLMLAQTRTYTGTVKDILTQLPVELVSISATGTNIGTVTNEEGKFRITMPDGTNSLTFNHLSYNIYVYSPENVNAELEVQIEPKEYTLDEVIVSSVPVDKLLGGIIKNSKKQLDKSILINTYCREFVKINGQYTTFADAMLDYNVRKQNGKADVYIKQSRARKIGDAVLAKKQIDTEGMAIFDVKEAIKDSYNFNAVEPLLSNEKDYDFELRNKSDSKGNTIQIVTISPKDNVEKALMMGSITYDLTTKLILEIDIKRSPEHLRFNKEVNILVARITITDIARKSVFTNDNGKYMMAYNQSRVGFHIKMKNRFDDTFEFLSDIVTLDYEEGDHELNRDLRYEEKSLYKAGTKHHEEFWKTQNVILLSDAEEQILRSFAESK